MDINIRPKPYLLFNAFHLIFIIFSIQVGVGLPGFQRIIVMESGHDAWISVIVAGIAAHLVVMVMIATLNRYGSADLYGIHQDIFGKWLGSIINTVFIAYLVLSTTVVFRAYIEIVQVWLFPELPVWSMAIFGGLLAIYAVLGGIRVVVGVSVLSVLFTLWMIFLLYFPIQYAEWKSLLPIFDTSTLDILKGAYKMSFTLAGFEILYYIYPYVKEKEKTSLFTHLGLLATNLLNLIIMVVSLVYFSEGQLLKTIWATLSMFKIIQLPFMERFEIIAISLWMLVILPNAILPLWAATRGMKRVFGFKQKYSLHGIVIIIFIAQMLLKTRDQVNMFFDWFSNKGFYLVFIYPFILYVLVLVVQKMRQKRGLASNETKAPSNKSSN